MSSLTALHTLHLAGNTQIDCLLQTGSKLRILTRLTGIFELREFSLTHVSLPPNLRRLGVVSLQPINDETALRRELSALVPSHTHVTLTCERSADSFTPSMRSI